MLIAVITPLYPTRNDPHRGQAIRQTVQALRGYADVRVFCANTRYPFTGSQPADGPLNPAEEDITMVSYPAVPLFGRPWNGAICARHIYRQLIELRPDLVLSYWLYPEG